MSQENIVNRFSICKPIIPFFMSIKVNAYRVIFSIFFLFLTQIATAFELNLTSTNESCPGNGSIAFGISNANPNGTITFVVFRLPNTTTPYATPLVPSVSGLSAGDYLVIATETVGNESTSQQSTASIVNTVSTLSYTVSYLNQTCSGISSIQINVITGTAASYQITAGPIIVPLQNSPIFNNLIEGTYTIRVFDACGVAVVTTFTVFYSQSQLSISNPITSDTNPPSCDFTTITNTITPNGSPVITYPLQVTYTIFPPDGSPSYTVNQTLSSGNATETTASVVVSNFAYTSFNYTMAIVDGCGVLTTKNFTVNFTPTATVSLETVQCDESYFFVSTGNLTPPFQLNFNQAPPDFNPINFNADYPGPYTTNEIVFGSEDNLVPVGAYSCTITDSCNRMQTIEFTTVLNIIPPNVSSGNNGCLTDDGFISISFPDNEVVVATVIAAPSAYPFPLPHDVSSQIVNGVLTLPSLPLGVYQIEVVDLCETDHMLTNIELLPYENAGLFFNEHVGCAIGKTSIAIESLNSPITSIIILQAPVDFQESTPYNASVFIHPTNGIVFMNNLVPGEYVFSVLDECGFVNELTEVLSGYTINSVISAPIFNCGSFDINLFFDSNGTYRQSFWLQKLIDSSTNAWGHPITNVVYPEGTKPTALNAIALTNNSVNFNFAFNGTFRMIRTFDSYNNAVDIGNQTTPLLTCIEILDPIFDFSEALEIIDISTASCTSNANLDVIVNAVGSEPLFYKLILKDGQVINIDNGTSPFFYSLPLGLYTLQVEDACGNIKTKVFNVENLNTLITTLTPDNLTLCATVVTGNERFDLTSQIDATISPANQSEYLVSFHTAITDAEQNLNPIINAANFNPVTNPQTVYMRITSILLPDCYAVKSFAVFAGQVPRINLQTDYLSCVIAPYTITINNPIPSNTDFQWSDGSTGTSFTTATPGFSTVQVTATTTYTNPALSCQSTRETTISISAPPEIESITTVDWTENQNQITVNTNNTGFHEFSLDGINYQTENNFSNLTPGVYTVYVRDTIGCGIISQVVWLLYYPKFFTPNGDGYNETWFINNSFLEEDFIVHIFDRYGKLLTIFNSQSNGWDGTYNGRMQFASDYWFMIFRKDGRVHRGHFTLKR